MLNNRYGEVGLVFFVVQSQQGAMSLAASTAGAGQKKPFRVVAPFFPKGIKEGGMLTNGI